MHTLPGCSLQNVKARLSFFPFSRSSPGISSASVGGAAGPSSLDEPACELPPQDQFPVAWDPKNYLMPSPSKKPSTTKRDVPYFDASDLTPEYYYVGRLDMMGARAAMTRSVGVSGNFIGKLHVAMLEAPRAALAALVPTVDGAYIVAKERDVVLDHMRAALRSLAKSFVNGENRYRQFVVRGGLAYGPVVLGASLESASDCLAHPANAAYRDSILIGTPVVQAYEVEEKAPPFGVRVDMSARTFASDGKPFGSAYWRWWKQDNADAALASKLKEKLRKYFEFMREHAIELDYPPDAIARHEQLTNEYFASA